LPVANGGTGATATTGSGNNVLATSPTLVTPILGTPTSGTLTNCTFPTLNQNTTGSAGSVANALTISSPLTGTSYNGSSAVSIGIPAATTSASGYLTSTDWNTFNNKGSGTVTSITVSAGTGMSGGGTVTSSGTVTLTNAGVTSIVAGTGISISGATGAVTISDLGLGIGQSWSNQTANRASGTSYTNSGTKPIFVAFQITSSGTTTLTAVVGGITVYSGNAQGNNQGVSFVVPTSASYSITFTNKQSNVWAELS
jgi:hypothetical protein